MSRPTRLIKVVVGLMIDAQRQILVAQRPPHVSHPGYWEFPGGKIESHETPLQALIREFNEEIGITVTDAVPYMLIEYDYADRIVMLDVWQITQYTGTPHGAEGQLVEWINIDKLPTLTFPAANYKIVQALLHGKQ